MKNKLPKDKFQDETRDIIVKTLTNLAEGLTGIAASKKQELALSIGHIFQRMRGGYFLSTFLKEWNKYREKGRIKDDYQYTEQHSVCLQELLEFLDNDSPDEIRFSILKQIFLVAATESISERDSFLPQQYMKICRSLAAGEILIMNACYRFSKENQWKNIEVPGAGDWLNKVAEATGLNHPELVEIHEDELIKKKLLTGRRYSDRSGVVLKPYFRLTSLAYEICRYIENYEPEDLTTE